MHTFTGIPGYNACQRKNLGESNQYLGLKGASRQKNVTVKMSVCLVRVSSMCVYTGTTTLKITIYIDYLLQAGHLTYTVSLNTWHNPVKQDYCPHFKTED